MITSHKKRQNITAATGATQKANHGQKYLALGSTRTPPKTTRFPITNMAIFLPKSCPTPVSS
jgi:hypothetical protein